MSKKSLPIALQMYTLRKLTLPLEDKLEQLAAIGYSGLEWFGPMEPAAPILAELLDKHGLRVISAHVAMEAMENDLESVVAYHRTLGNDMLVVPWLAPDKRSPDAAGWQALGSRLATLGRRCADLGMRLSYHNHDFEMALIDGQTAMEWLLDAAAPGNVGAEFDLAWVVRGGGDPVALLQKYAGRCGRVHVKDLAASITPDNPMGLADVGAGILDWASILPAAAKAGAEWYIIEHDDPSAPMTSVANSYAYLHSKLTK